MSLDQKQWKQVPATFWLCEQLRAPAHFLKMCHAHWLEQAATFKSCHPYSQSDWLLLGSILSASSNITMCPSHAPCNHWELVIRSNVIANLCTLGSRARPLASTHRLQPCCSEWIVLAQPLARRGQRDHACLRTERGIDPKLNGLNHGLNMLFEMLPIEMPASRRPPVF